MLEGKPLYGQREARCLQWREALRDSDGLKYELLLAHVGDCTRLVDIGCGWGQFLGLVPDRVEELWGVDESPDRIRDVAKTCPRARMVVCRADRLELPDDYFDAVVTSQMLHEVKLFGREGELGETLSEIRRVTAPGGRCLLLDHQDAGDGDVVVDLPAEQMGKLAEFEGKFRFYAVSHETLADGNIRISRRALQDFLTKDCWCATDMESMEMNETHNVFGEGETVELVSAAGLDVREWINFTDIRDDLARHGGTLIEGDPWSRKFLLIAGKS